MKKYIFRVYCISDFGEFTDMLQISIKASTEDQARKLAIEKYSSTPSAEYFLGSGEFRVVADLLSEEPI